MSEHVKLLWQEAVIWNDGLKTAADTSCGKALNECFLEFSLW